MMMDITCPAELMRLEQTAFSDGRRQAYLTFVCEAEAVITALTGRLTLLDGQGNAIERRLIRFTGLYALPGESFVCNLALDGFPAFESGLMALESVEFDQEEMAWEADPARMTDCTPPLLPEGQLRNALISVVGRDAVCYPQKLPTHWVCACGRFNLPRWLVCRRCLRDRDEVLGLTPDRVTALYEARLQSEEEALQAQSTARARRPRPGPVKKQAPKKRRREETKSAYSVAPRAVLAVAACVLSIALLVWGGRTLIQRLSTPQEIAGVAGQGTALPVDYLEPVG